MRQIDHINRMITLQVITLSGFDLSRHGLDRDSRSRHWQRAGLDSRDFLDSLKNDIFDKS
jgi:hypothetical protein